jgi:hypothetical protein
MDIILMVACSAWNHWWSEIMNRMRTLAIAITDRRGRGSGCALKMKSIIIGKRT